VSRPALLRTGLLALGVAAALAVAGCGQGAVAEPESGDEVAALPQSAAETVDATLGELSAVDGGIRVGEELTVLVDLPDQGWEVSNSNPSAVEIAEEGSSGGARLVRITGIAAGESLVAFEIENGERDELAVSVSE
jgi:hypothetical protein